VRQPTVEDATEDALFGGLVEQLAVLRPLIESFDHLTCVHHSPRQLAVVGNSGAVAVSLTASASSASGCSLRLDVVSSVSRWQAHFADDALARGDSPLVHVRLKQGPAAGFLEPPNVVTLSFGYWKSRIWTE
jgi:hypothetical protein